MKVVFDTIDTINIQLLQSCALKCSIPPPVGTGGYSNSALSEQKKSNKTRDLKDINNLICYKQVAPTGLRNRYSNYLLQTGRPYGAQK